MAPEAPTLHSPASTTAAPSRWAQLDTSTRALVIVLAIGGFSMAALTILGYPAFLPYGWHLTLHILGAVIFLGNIIVTALWMAFMVVAGEPRAVHRAGQATQWADVAFTAPGTFLLLGNGLIMLGQIGGFAAHPWATASLALFGVTGLVWAAVLIPAQQKLVTLAGQHVASGTKLGEAFHRTFRRWAIAGSFATILPLIVLALMVLKPGL